jgi:hypothetical protein
MRLMLISFALIVGVGYLLGGRLSNLTTLKIRWAPMAMIGFILQLINPPGDWPLVLLATSFVLLWIFAIGNLGTPGFGVIAIGVALNFLVIVANDGMPVSAGALEASGQGDTIGDLTNHADAYVKHHLADDDDVVLFLGDVIGVPAPVSQAISVGDLFTYGGVGIVVVAGMRRRRPGPAPAGAAVRGAEGVRA